MASAALTVAIMQIASETALNGAFIRRSAAGQRGAK
jgi:hypothetical protein